MSPPNKTQAPASTESSVIDNPFTTQINSEIAGTLGEAGSIYLQGVLELNREIASFINKRLEHDAELTRSLGQCKDWQEITELQQNWFREAAEEYANNAKTLMGLTTRIMNDTFAPLRRIGNGGNASQKD